MHPALANKSTLIAPGEPPTDPSTLGGREGQLRDMLREKFTGAHRSPPAKRPEGVRRLCVVLPDSLQPEGVGPNDEIDLSGWRQRLSIRFDWASRTGSMLAPKED